MLKICKDCGEEYDGTNNSRFCPSCRQRRAHEGMIRKRQEIKETLSYRKGNGKKAVQPVQKFVDNKECRSCLYGCRWDTLGIGCQYILITGKMRPGNPPPNCSAYRPNNSKEREELMKKNKELPLNHSQVSRHKKAQFWWREQIT